MTISAAQVRELRERTGLGMMECKKALLEVQGDLNAAAELLRKKAGSKAEGRAGRTAAEGAIAIHQDADGGVAGMVEVNSETDFVAKNDDFLSFVDAVAAVVARRRPASVAALMGLSLREQSGETIGQAHEALVAKLGEHIGIRRFAIGVANGAQLDSYLHGRRIGVVVEIEGGTRALAHDVAMHVAASRPQYTSKDQVPVDAIAKEKEIFAAQAKDSGKSVDIVEKIVEGRVVKYLSEITLLDQPFVKDPDITVEKMLRSANARVRRFIRYEVGEGIEKIQNDFASEVMAQVRKD
jgi:elongation factor Ts